MKVAVLQDYLRVGGTEHQTLWLAAKLRSETVDTHVVCFRPGGALAQAADLNGIKRHVLQPFDSYLNGWAPGLVPKLRALGVDCVIAMGREANATLPRLRAAFPGCRLIATFRTGRAVPRRYRRGLHCADVILANADWGRERLLAMRLPQDKIAVVPNALLRAWDFDQVTSVREHMRATNGVQPGETVLLNVGAFRRSKGQAEAIRVLQLLAQRPGWRAWFVGDGPRLASCRKRARQFGLEQRVVFHGYQADPFPYYCAADVVWHTSRSEALPNALVEAQAVGRPWVAYAEAGVGECCLSGQTGWVVNPGDGEAMAAVLMRLMDDPDARKRAGRQAAHWARERFSPPAVLQAIRQHLG